MVVVGLLLAVAIVAAAPTIVSRTPLRNVILNSLLTTHSSQLACKQAAFRWLGGQSLEGLSIVDGEGRQILAVESVSVNRSLVELLANTNDLGNIQIVQPRLHVMTRANGSNVEDLIRQELGGARRELKIEQLAPRAPQPLTLNIHVEIVDGTIEGVDSLTSSRWMLSGFNARLQLAGGSVTEVAGEGALIQELGVARREARVGSPGNFKFRLHQDDADGQRLDLVADRLALDVVSPWFARVVPGGQIAGTVSIDGTVQWDGGKRKAESGKRKADRGGQALVAASGSRGAITWHSRGKLESSRLRIAADVLQGDVIECDRLTVPWQLAASDNLLDIEQLTVDTEWGHIAAKGSLDVAQLVEEKKGSGTIDRNGPEGASHPWFLPPFFPASLPNQDGQLEARLDMARLAAMLPSTLRIRHGVQIDSGDLQLVAKSLPDSTGSSGNSHKWTAHLALQNLEGSEGQRHIRWDQPIELQLELENRRELAGARRGLQNKELAPRASQLPTTFISRLAFHSPFLEANLKTAAEVVDGNFSFDLEKLASQVGQLVDLSPWQLRGQGSGTMVLQSLADDRFKASAMIELQGVESWKTRGASSESGNSRLTTPDPQLIWSEPQLRVNLQASGLHHHFQPQQIATASVQLRGANDSLELQLIEPVEIVSWGLGVGGRELELVGSREARGASYFPLTPNPQLPTPNFPTVWPIRVEANGPLDVWAGRIRPWTSALPDELRGNAVLTAIMRVGPELVDVSEMQLQVTRLHAQSGSYVVDEPQLQLTGDCRWDAGTGSLSTGQLQLVTSTIALRTQNVAIGKQVGKQFEVGGEMAFRADMERLAAALGLVGGPSATWPRGMCTGRIRLSTLQLSTGDSAARADISIAADSLQIIQTASQNRTLHGVEGRELVGASSSILNSRLAPPNSQLIWTEPHVDASAKLTYSEAADQLRLDDVRVASQAVQLQGSITVDKLAGEGTVLAKGILDYDWDTLSGVLATHVGPGVQLQGKDQTKFQLAGRLFDNQADAVRLHWSQRWTASADARIASGSVYGLPLHDVPVQLALGNGLLQTAPLGVPIGQGQLTLNPHMVLFPEPQYLLLPPGPLVTNVRISPEVSEKMLKYIAPAMAGATRAEGLFSVQLEGARIPLANLKQADVTGRLAIHQLNLSPGPMVQEMVTLVEQIEALAKRRPPPQAGKRAGRNAVTIDNRTVDFRVVEGRVYHRGLEFLVDGAPIRSSGSVGFDQSLAITLEVPIQAKWVEHERALQPLAGQVLQIPIQGTFQHPQVDQRAVADLSRRMFQGVAERAIGDEINKQFNKLLRRK